MRTYEEFLTWSMTWQLHCQFFCFFYAINKTANVFWVKSVRIFILSWPERLKRPSDFRIFLTIFRRLLNFAEDVWGCSDYLWALLKLFKRRHFFCVVILFVHKVNIKHFFWNIVREIELNCSYKSYPKKQFPQIGESGMRNCPWCVRSLSSVRWPETHT